mgnify:CR=1 FL=1
MAIFQVQTVNGQKQLTPMTGGVPDGSVGSLIMKYKKIQPKNCLYCDGRDTTGTDEELRIYYPALYMYLGSNVLPDYRECTFVGAEQNTTDNIATHDVYTQGQFKDDQMQKITGKATLGVAGVDSFGGFVGSGFSGAISGGDGKKQTFKAYDTQSANSYSSLNINSSQVTRTGTPDVTHGKQKAVYVYIVAVDSVVVSDDESFLRVVENYVDDKILVSQTLVGTYTVASKATISVNITSLVPATPQGYSRFTQVFVEDQNYAITSVNFVNGQIYANIYNGYTGSLTYRLFTWVMYYINIKQI